MAIFNSKLKFQVHLSQWRKPDRWTIITKLPPRASSQTFHPRNY